MATCNVLHRVDPVSKTISARSGVLPRMAAFPSTDTRGPHVALDSASSTLGARCSGLAFRSRLRHRVDMVKRSALQVALSHWLKHASFRPSDVVPTNRTVEQVARENSTQR